MDPPSKYIPSSIEISSPNLTLSNPTQTLSTTSNPPVENDSDSPLQANLAQDQEVTIDGITKLFSEVLPILFSYLDTHSQRSLMLVQKGWSKFLKKKTSNLLPFYKFIQTLLAENTPTMIDLVEYCGSHLFIIDGDSLLLHTLSFLDWTYGGQSLSFLFLIERFLQNLFDLSSTFRIVFFRVNQFIWPKSLLYLREVTIRHLQTSVSVFVDLMDGWFDIISEKISKEWLEYLEHHRPAFLLVEDGFSKLVPLNGKVYFSCFLLQCIGRGYPCVYIRTLTFSSQTVSGFIQKNTIRIKPRASICSIMSRQRHKPVNLLVTNEEIQNLCEKHGWKLGVYVGIMAHVLKTTKETENVTRSKCLLIHLLLQDLLPIKWRCLALPPDYPPSSSKYLKFFFFSMWSYFNTTSTPVPGPTPSALADFFDGRLFYQVLSLCGDGLQKEDLPPEIASQLPLLWDSLCEVLEEQLPLFPVGGGTENENFVNFVPEPQTYLNELLPIQSPLVAAVTGQLLSYGETLSDFETPRPFKEHHWHSCTLIEDTFWMQTEKDQKPKYFKHRYEAQFLKHTRDHAESLGPMTHFKAVVALKDDRKTEKNKSKNQHPVPKKQPPKSKKDVLIERNLQKKQSQSLRDFTQIWEEIRSDPTPTKVNNFINMCKESKVDVRKVAVVAYYYRLENYILNAWRKIPSVENKLEVFQDVQIIYKKFWGLLDLTQQNTLKKILDEVELPDAAQLLDSNNANCNQLSSRPSILFQLIHMGHLLSREVSSVPDSRVNFIPDDWQRELLDVVDSNGSALIVAPTSSGKTFISFYCIEKVLREGTDGIVVYVSPTKALVNQMIAEVYARFHLCQSRYTDGKSLFGVFTRDYRYKAMQCQVLVTVPQCLEILLLSGSNFMKWRQNIKYVIFDEVHTIGSTEEGSVWEHLLLLIECPFLALSATISNPDEFAQWLQKNQELLKQQHEKRGIKTSRTYKLAVIYHHYRYSDLRKSIYVPKLEEKMETLKSVWPSKRNEENILNIHPCFGLNLGRLHLENGFPDINLEPRDCVVLYQKMKNQAEFLPNKLRESLQKLDPETYYLWKNEREISRAMVRKYEEDLKNELLEWGKAGLYPQLKKALKIDSHVSEIIAKREIEKKDNHEYLISNILPLLLSLNTKDESTRGLPAIVFCLSRYYCEYFAENLVKILEEAQIQKEKDPNEIEKRKRNEKIERRANKIKKANRDKEEKEKKGNEKKEDLWYEEETEVDPEFSFKYCLVEGFKETDLEMLVKKMGMKNSPRRFLFDALQRGIGVHHAGLGKKYRELVERGFRSGALGVVFATSTLALGIHMPCKTVVFAGDSYYLSPLYYRQMSGRSGRRGFDLLGNVVFFGINEMRIKQLMSSDVPKLKGHFPLTTTLVLRCIMLYSNCPDKQSVIDSLQRLTSQPLFAFGHEKLILNDQMTHYFRFSVEYLRRKGLIEADGTPVGLAGLVSHLYWTEPSNFLFHTLLEKGVFDDVCSTENLLLKGEEQVMREMMVIICHVFERKELHSSIIYAISLKKTPSKVILEPLPPNVKKILNLYNKEVIETLQIYLKSYALQLDSVTKEYYLPVSRIPFPSDKKHDGISNSLLERIKSRVLPYSVPSAFIALCGKDDRFTSLEDLATSVRPEICIDVSAVPMFQEKKEETLLNRYALDFFCHGQLETISKANGLRAGEAWTNLKSFEMILKAISSALQLLATDPNLKLQPITLQMFVAISDRFSFHMKKTEQ